MGIKLNKKGIWFCRLMLLIALLLVWHWVTRDPQLAFFFGEPLIVMARIWEWFTAGTGILEVGIGDSTWFVLQLPAQIYPHLIVTLTETLLAFVIGTVLAVTLGLWLALSPIVSSILDPYIKAANVMPRVILAPIFAMWFGLGIWSKIALAGTLVFFIVFFNVYQGVKEVSSIILTNAKMLGANSRQLLSTVYIPSAASWVFSSLHTSVGLAFIGVIVGEYLGSSRGVGYLILQAEGTFDINSVFAGIVVLTGFALAFDMLVGMIERRLMKWQPGQGKMEQI